MKILVYPSPMEVIRSMAELFVRLASHSIEQKKRCRVLLSGGSSPKQLYELLEAGYCDKLDWSSLYFFFGDERYVPFEDPQSNGFMAKKCLFDPLHIADDHIFYINTALPQQQAASSYEKTIHDHFGAEEPVFDIVLLGLGDNSHTASLFPHTSVLHEQSALVKDLYVEEVKQHRITVTAPLINKARNVVFLVYGAGKAQAVSNIIEGEKNIEEYPAQLIAPADGELYWVMDKAAATLLHH